MRSAQDLSTPQNKPSVSISTSSHNSSAQYLSMAVSIPSNLSEPVTGSCDPLMHQNGLKDKEIVMHFTHPHRLSRVSIQEHEDDKEDEEEEVDDDEEDKDKQDEAVDDDEEDKDKEDEEEEEVDDDEEDEEVEGDEEDQEDDFYKKDEVVEGDEEDDEDQEDDFYKRFEIAEGDEEDDEDQEDDFYKRFEIAEGDEEDDEDQEDNFYKRFEKVEEDEKDKRNEEDEESEGDEEDEVICSICEETVVGNAYSCVEPHCKFHLHESCYNLKKEMHHKSHPEHPLTLLRLAPYKDGEYTCNACSSDGTGFTYHCSICTFDLHPQCASLAETAKRDDHDHELELLYACPVKGEDYKFTCAVCHTDVQKDCWVYYCAPCDYGTHSDCVDCEERDGTLDPQAQLRMLQFQMHLARQNAQFVASLGSSLASLA